MSIPTEQRLSSNIRKTIHNGQTVFEKQYITNDWDDDPQLILRRASREVGLLHAISASDSFGGRLGVVQVAKSDPSSATIATVEIEGATLEHVILHDKRRKTSLKPWFLAGQWLRQFHTLSIESNSSEYESKNDPTDIVDYCNLRLSSMAEYGYDWPHEKTKQRLLKRIAALRDLRENSPRVWVHADYAPGNLMWDGNILTPIDFAMVRFGTPLDDATYLIHRMEMHKLYRPWLFIPSGSIASAILKGLGQPQAADSSAYKLLMIKHLICRLHTYARRSATSLKQALHDRYVCYFLRRRLMQAITGE